MAGEPQFVVTDEHLGLLHHADSTALAPEVRDLVADVRSVSPVPVAVGFGISTPEHVAAIARADADGVVVASALVDALGPDGLDVDAAARLAGALREATVR